METLELAPAPEIGKKRKSAQFRTGKPTPIFTPVIASSIKKENDVVAVKPKSKWFLKNTSENLTNTEAIIRGALIITMPMLSAIDWNYGTHTMFFIAPVIFYLEVTAFTMYCPIKALFSNYGRSSHFE
ncbi:MAG: hypothetical protein M3O71_05045 [Bacteroidota bacterium]|nr:hypothetical protein [Bacteroidota bacterium]